jgi:hypothetical protein
MKKTLLATAGSALALVLLAHSLPASADVDVTATINKTKDITVTEFITIFTTVFIDVDIAVAYRSAAEADAIVNQTSTDNTVTHTVLQLDPSVDPEDITNFGIRLTASITDSINDNTGIVNVNQDVGNMSNQGNQLALAVATPANTGAVRFQKVLLNSQSEADQRNERNSVFESEQPDPRTDLFTGPNNQSAEIDGSINGNTGVVNVNQNSGNMNNQANSEALAVAIDLAGVALSEAALGQVNMANNGGPGGDNTESTGVLEAGVTKLASITDSLNGNTGVGGVNQAAGNMANQANTFSLSFIDSGGGVGGITP